MIALFVYLLLGFIMLAVLLSENWVYEMGILDSLFERLVFIWAWPAFLLVMLMFPLCRDDDAPVHPKL